MNRKKIKLFMLSTLLLGTLFVSGCGPKECVDPVPPAGTRVTSTSDVFKRAAQDLGKDAARMSDATCYIDGIQSSCSLALACLRNGWCVKEAK